MAADTLNVLVGTAHPEATPWPVFDPRVLDFFADFSAALRHSPLAGDTEAASFAFWCRRSRLEALARRWPGPRLGRGLLFHVPPANVPLLFAYSLAVGMLAGCANVMRLSSRLDERAGTFCAVMEEVLSRPEHAALRARTGLVTYPREESDRTADYILNSDGKVIWGGDRTVEAMRAFPTRPGAVELVFPDRWSLALLSQKHIAGLSDEELDILAHRFYNDTYLMDQNACSSPKLVVWLRDCEKGEEAVERFWTAVADHAAHVYELTPYKVARKYEGLCELSLTQPGIGPVKRVGNLLYRLPLPEGGLDLDRAKLAFGSFLEWSLDPADGLTPLKPLITPRTQTLTVAGPEPAEVARMAAEAGLTGIDRVVGVGQAMEFSLIWDGKDLIAQLSRAIQFE